MPVMESKGVIRKIAVGMVIYNPNENVVSRIQAALDAHFNVYVFDNSPDNSIVREAANRNSRLKYITSGKNLGLGLGISTICASAYYDGYSALVFFDQDTVFGRETLSFVEEYFLKNIQLMNNYSAIAFKSEENSSPARRKNEVFRDVMLAINSGSLYMLENAKKINWHNEKYFVDCVDYDFCLQSRINKLKIGEYSATPGFDHVSEQGDNPYQIFGKSYLLRAYSSRRILDTVVASSRLLIDSLIHGQISFAKRVGWLFAIYMASQVLVRLSPKKTTT